MLDLKIRDGSSNRKSLDDVMRGLYRKYYLQKKRGFTDAEFRAECEGAAGTSLGEIFEYASTSRQVDYKRYFALAGLALDVTTEETPGGYIGLDTRTQEIPQSELPIPAGRGGRGGRGGGPAFRLVVTDAAAGSPAATAGLQPGDRILTVDGTPVTASVLNDAITAKAAGGRITLRVSRAGAEMDIPIEVARKVKRTFHLSEADQPSPSQIAILNAWLSNAP
jgi:predicted metalloprotease with PDZ domain